MTMLYLYEITDIDSIKEDQAILGKMNKKRNLIMSRSIYKRNT